MGERSRSAYATVLTELRGDQDLCAVNVPVSTVELVEIPQPKLPVHVFPDTVPLMYRPLVPERSVTDAASPFTDPATTVWAGSTSGFVFGQLMPTVPLLP